MEEVIIYTDGACSCNPGPGGWGAVLMLNNAKKEISGYVENTTNNAMEMTAIIEALSLLKRKCIVKVHSDSAYIVNAYNQQWIKKWKTNNWKTSGKDPVKNRELWEKLDSLIQEHEVTFVKVKGHSTDVWNNRCDELATGEIKKNIK